MELLRSALAGAISLAIFAPATADAGVARPAESAGRIAIPASAPASSPHPLTLPEIVELREIDDIRLSPDGKTVAFLLKQASVRENDSRIALFRMDVSGGAPVKLLEEKSLSGLRWTADGTFLTYLFGEGEQSGIWRIAAAGGRPELHVHHATPIGSYDLSPDGSRIAFLSSTSPTEEQKSRLDAAGVVYDDETMNLRDVGSKNWIPTRSELWIAEPGKPGQARRLWENAHPISGFRWSRDGRRLAVTYSAPARPEEPLIAFNSDIGIADVESGRFTPFAESARAETNPGWSPDGESLAFFSSGDIVASNAIFVRRLDGGEARNLTSPFRLANATGLFWSADGARIVISKSDREQSGLFAVPAGGGTVRRLNRGEDHLDEFSFDRAEGRAACRRQNTGMPPEVALLDVATGETRTLTALNPEYRNISLGKVRELSWTNALGYETNGYLIEPIGYTPGRRYPFLVMLYGFSNTFISQAEWISSFPAQVFAARGWAVLLMNYPRYDRKWAYGDFKEAFAQEAYSPLASIEKAHATLVEMGIGDPEAVGDHGLELRQLPDRFHDHACAGPVPGGLVGGGRSVRRRALLAGRQPAVAAVPARPLRRTALGGHLRAVPRDLARPERVEGEDAASQGIRAEQRRLRSPALRRAAHPGKAGRAGLLSRRGPHLLPAPPPHLVDAAQSRLDVFLDPRRGGCGSRQARTVRPVEEAARRIAEGRRAMTSRTAALAGLGVFGAGLLFAAPSDAPIRVGPNVLVSRQRADVAHNEIMLAADPQDPRRLLGCSMAFDPERNRVFTVVYASADGGASWTPTLETADYEFTGDPACAFGKGGRAYYMALGWKEDGKPVDPVYASSDFGNTWSAPSVMHGFHGLDREYLTVDNTGGKFDGRVYAHATGWVRPIHGTRKAADISVFASRDGQNFWGPLKRASVDRRYVLGVGNGVVLSDGTLVTIFGEVNRFWDDAGESGDVPESTPEKANAALRIISSKDGGESLEESAAVSDFHMFWPPNSTSAMAYLGADPGSAAFKDRLYAVWPDQRSGRQEILIAHSTDKGKTWSKPRTVNDDPAPFDPASPRDHLMPTVAVNRDGVVGVAWYDRRDNPDNLGWWVRFRASLDGGETFLPSVRVSEAPMQFGASDRWTVQGSASGGGKKPPGDPEAKAPGGPLRLDLGLNGFQFNGGHTGGLAADAAGVFHTFWVDNRTGLAQIWTAPVTVTGSVWKHGAPELDALDDVSDRVAFEIERTSFDRASNRLTVSAKLKNTSDAVIRSPFKVRLLALTSQVGAPEVLDAENGGKGPGAVWDFGGAVPGGVLAPGQESAPRTLSFKLTNLKPFRQGKTIRYGVASLDARVLAKLEKLASPEKAGPAR